MPQALIAAAAGGPYVYALGYFNHVLFQFDTRSGRLANATVGSAGGHVSRNFFADERGHAFVPRVTRDGDRSEATWSSWMPVLKEVGSTPLEEYFEREPNDSHGIVAIQPDGSGGWYFTTGKGRLYHEEPQPAGPSRVGDLGWFHPDGSRYVASLFRDASSGTLYGVASPSSWGSKTFEWVARRADGSVTIAPAPVRLGSVVPPWRRAVRLDDSRQGRPLLRRRLDGVQARRAADHAVNRRASPHLHGVRVEEQIRAVLDHSTPARADGDPAARYDHIARQHAVLERPRRSTDRPAAA